jgi:hypothetical protein
MVTRRLQWANLNVADPHFGFQQAFQIRFLAGQTSKASSISA